MENKENQGAEPAQANKDTIKVGDVVNYHSCVGGAISSTGHVVEDILPEPNNFGGTVAWVTGKSSCVSLAALSLGDGSNYLVKRTQDDNEETPGGNECNIVKFLKAINKCTGFLQGRHMVARLEFYGITDFDGDFDEKYNCFDIKLDDGELSISKSDCVHKNIKTTEFLYELCDELDIELSSRG